MAYKLFEKFFSFAKFIHLKFLKMKSFKTGFENWILKTIFKPWFWKNLQINLVKKSVRVRLGIEFFEVWLFWKHDCASLSLMRWFQIWKKKKKSKEKRKSKKNQKRKTQRKRPFSTLRNILAPTLDVNLNKYNLRNNTILSDLE